jgi:hypothetical protein
MRAEAVGDLAGDLAEDRVDRREVDGDLRVLDRARVEERDHQAQPIALAAEVERLARLPGAPDGADRVHGLPHPRRGRRPAEAVATLDVPAHLRAETEREAAGGEALQRPGGERGHGGAARERHRDGRADAEPRRRLRGESGDDVRVLLRLLDDQSVVAERLDEPRVLGDAGEVERRRRRAEPGIDLAEREQRLDDHESGLANESSCPSGSSRWK